jgi:hypothetical protein
MRTVTHAQLLLDREDKSALDRKREAWKRCGDEFACIHKCSGQTQMLKSTEQMLSDDDD